MRWRLPTAFIGSALFLAGCSFGTDTQGLTKVESFSDCDVCPEMVVVPKGEFRMGGLTGKGEDPELPVRTVRIEYDFAIGMYEVTQREWVAIMGSNPSYKKNMDGPVDRVNFQMAMEYIRKLSRITGYRFRLPSEAEWEYAARAGTSTNYFWGDKAGSNNAACRGCGGKWNGKIAPVGSFQANPFGIYDMHGNVSEWVSDCLHYNYKDAPTDGSPWIKNGNCSWRIFRGGSMWGYTVDIRSSSRDWYQFRGGGTGVGFRIARDIDH